LDALNTLDALEALGPPLAGGSLWWALVPCAPRWRVPRAPWSALTVAALRSTLCSEPLTTCAEPTLFFGSKLAAAP
jgi:hypothetical protein